MTRQQPKCFVATYYRIDPHSFHYLKFILEGYDNLAVISAVQPGEGIIRLLCARESLAELLDLLASIVSRIKRPILL